MKRVERLLEQAVQERVFPAAQAVVVHRGETVFSGAFGAAGPHTLFDLASLTKVMATTSAFVALWRRGLVRPELRLGELLPSAAAGEVTLEDLLRHRAGLPPSPAAFAWALTRWPALLTAPTPRLRTQARAAVVEQVAKLAPTGPARAEAVYSDVGFILLGEALAAAAGVSLDALYEQEVARPLGLTSRYRRLSAAPPAAEVAPTGATRPRGPPPGVADPLPELARVPTAPGEVDDDNCWVMDGVAGHAGLFGTAEDVARFGQAVLEDFDGAGRLAPVELWREVASVDPVTPRSTRAIGFDTPSAQGSSAGARLASSRPPAIGHLGFTGTSLWIDLSRKLVVALLTNRTYFGRAEVRIKDLRPKFHDAVVEALSNG